MGFIKIEDTDEAVQIHKWLHDNGIHHHAPELIADGEMMVAPDYTTFGTSEDVDKLIASLQQVFPDIEVKK